MLFISILIFVVIPSFGQTNGIGFKYELVWKEDSLNLNDVKKEKFILQVKQGESCFQSMKLYDFSQNLIDFEKTIKSGGVIGSRAVNNIRPVFNYRIYKSAASLKVEESMMRKWYTYPMDFDTGGWEIHAEQDSVAGYWSQKATIDHNGRSFVAWFANTIPVPDGPYVFHGLPGLIVQLYDTQLHYTFTLTAIDEGDTEWPEDIKNITSSTFEKISEMKRKLREDPLIDPLMSGFFSDPQAIDNFRQRAKKNNNPLEKNQ